MVRDRLKGAFAGLVHGADPTSLYERLWRAKVVSQSGDLLTVGVLPDDPRLPTMDHVPLRHGVPGLTVGVAAGAFLRVGWDDGDPTQPFAALWDGASSTGLANANGGGSGGAVQRVIFGGAEIQLGGITAVEQVIWGTSRRLLEKPMLEALKNWFGTVTAAIAATPSVPVPNKASVAAAAIILAPLLVAFNLQDFLSQTTKTK